ncbi:MAG: hypothetical protein ACI9CD_001195 [Candidatus Deianiraeaceae bacterium]|jgi:hypothetical protein
MGKKLFMSVVVLFIIIGVNVVYFFLNNRLQENVAQIKLNTQLQTEDVNFGK